MKVKILKDGLYGDRNYMAGQTADLVDDLARRVFADGDGEPADVPPQANAPTTPPPAEEASKKAQKLAAGDAR